MPNRRTFFATAASGLAWLLGAKGEKPARMVACEYQPDIQKEVPVLMHQTLSDGTQKWWTEKRIVTLHAGAITLNQWRSLPPCEN